MKEEEPLYVQNGDVRIAYWVRGGGPQTLLLVMGINMRAAHWGEHFVAALAEQYRVVTFDNRGTGHSTRPVETITAELWAADALAVLGAVGAERAHVLGYSMGGRIAQQLAVTCPERLLRLVLLSSGVGGPRAGTPTERAMSGFRPRPGVDPQKVREDALAVLLGAEFLERYPERFRALVEIGGFKRTPGSVLMKQLQVAETGVYAGLEKLEVPTAVIHGDTDELVPTADGQLLASLIPGAQLTLLQGCGHIPTWEQPDRLLEVVLSFLAAA